MAWKDPLAGVQSCASGGRPLPDYPGTSEIPAAAPGMSSDGSVAWDQPFAGRVRSFRRSEAGLFAQRQGRPESPYDCRDATDQRAPGPIPAPLTNARPFAMVAVYPAAAAPNANSVSGSLARRNFGSARPTRRRVIPVSATADRTLSKVV